MADKVSGIHTGFRKKRRENLLLRAVARMKWHQRTVWQMAV